MFLFWGKELICFYNDAYRPSLGMNGKHPNALGQRGEDCWPEIWDDIKPIIDSVFEGGEANWSEDQLLPIYRNGKLEDVYWTYSYSPVIDESGYVGGVFVTCSETTAKMSTLRKLRESEDELTFAIEAAELGTYDYNPQNHKFKANSRLKDWFGFPSEAEIDLSHAFAVIVEKDKARVNAAIENSLNYETDGKYEIIYSIMHPVTKLTRTVLAKGKCSFDENRVPYRLNGTLQDITKQVRNKRKLEKEKRTADLAIKTGELGVYEVNLRTNELKSNARFNEIYGVNKNVDREELVAMCHPDDRAIRSKALEKGMESGAFEYEARFLRTDDNERWLRVRGTVSYNGQHEPIAILGVIQDITEQKKLSDFLSKEVENRTLELQQSNADLLQFAHVISHDLKEPVRKIRTFNGRLMADYKELIDEKGQGYMEKIEHSTERMYAMIDGVLSYSTLNNVRIPNERININAVIKQVETDLELLIQKKTAIIHTKELPIIEGAPILIHQLFYNLINNSLKFSSPDRKPIISIKGEVVKKKTIEYARITVKDNGIGFPDEFREKIFSTFIRLHPKDLYEGTGLGLALCKRIVERHHGTISAESKVNNRAVFLIHLPLIQTLRN